MALSRRRFLEALGWSAAGITVAAGGVGTFVPRSVLPHRGAPTPADASAWLSLRPDGTIEILSPRAEIGQGIATAFRQIVAEETGLPFERIGFVHPRTDRLPPARATVGSDSIKDFAPLLARAAASLATTLRQLGAVRLDVPAGTVRLEDGVVVSGDGRRVPLGALAWSPLVLGAADIRGARARSFDRAISRALVGTSPEPDGLRALVTGSASLFADDMRLPGMVFGTALRAPRLGAELMAVDDGPARGVAGYLGLHRDGAFAGIVAESRGALERALLLLRASWSDRSPVTQASLDRAIDIDEALARGGLEHTPREDSIGAEGPFSISLRLDVPMAAHAAMEPRCAVARFEAGRLEVWTGSQDVTFAQRVLADELGLDAEAVVVHGCRVGGGFGGRTIPTVELEAARLARLVGRPVKVQWTRADEFREAFYRPPSSHRILARLTPDGRIRDWHHAFRSGHVIFTSAAMGPLLQRATSFVGDPGVARGAIPPYAAARIRVEFEDVRLLVHTGPWRGLGAAPNVWAIETAIDALSRAAGRDPVAFRLANLPPEQARLRRVLERVAAVADWSSRRSTDEVGYGVACGIYKDMSYAAVVAEVALDGEAPRVRHLWCAHDCGLVVNPDGVRAQIEGNLVWSVGMALHERLGLADGHVSATSYGDYTLPRYSDVPGMTVELVDEGDPPSGAGETAIVAGTAAITNAIAAATGRVVTRLPFEGAAA